MAEFTSDDVKKLREDYNLRREDLASKLGTTVTTIYRWETGRAKPNLMAVQALLRLRQELGHNGSHKVA